jgi:hypothetical protein
VKCANCSAEIGTGSQFCAVCGAQVSDAASAGVPGPGSAPAPWAPPAPAGLTKNVADLPASAVTGPEGRAAAPAAGPGMGAGAGPGAGPGMGPGAGPGFGPSWQPTYPGAGAAYPAGVPGWGTAGTGYGVPAAVPAQPRGTRPKLVPGILAFLGAVLAFVASAVPFTQLNLGNGHMQAESLFTPGPGAPGALYWFAVEPVGVALIAILCGVLLLNRRKGRVQVLAASMLIALGFQTLFLFAGYAFGYLYSGNHIGAGGPVGMVAGVLLGAAGFAGLTGNTGEPSQDSVPGSAAVAPGPGAAAPYPPPYPGQ